MPHRPRFLLAVLLAAAAPACGDGDGDPVGDPAPGELANRIEEIAVERKPEEKPKPPRLGVLDEAGLAPEWRAGPSCRLRRGGRLLLVANAAGALATVDGRAARLAVAGPVGPSGGFFEAPGVTVSIGGRPAAGGEAPGPWMRAGITVGGAPDRPVERHAGEWGCFPG